jgi:hypothetical protein
MTWVHACLTFCAASLRTLDDLRMLKLGGTGKQQAARSEGGCGLDDVGEGAQRQRRSPWTPELTSCLAGVEFRKTRYADGDERAMPGRRG